MSSHILCCRGKCGRYDQARAGAKGARKAAELAEATEFLSDAIEIIEVQRQENSGYNKVLIS